MLTALAASNSLISSINYTRFSLPQHTFLFASTEWDQAIVDPVEKHREEDAACRERAKYPISGHNRTAVPLGVDLSCDLRASGRSRDRTSGNWPMPNWSYNWSFSLYSELVRRSILAFNQMYVELKYVQRKSNFVRFIVKLLKQFWLLLIFISTLLIIFTYAVSIICNLFVTLRLNLALS